MDSDIKIDFQKIAEQGMTEEFKDVEKLYEATYRLDMRLEKNKEKLTEEIYNLIKEDIADTYWAERTRIHNRYDIDHQREDFEHSMRSAALVPYARRFLFFHKENVAAKLIMENVNINMDAFFAESEAENDKNRPDYMPKMYLSRAQKREAKREARQERRRERKAEKEKRARLRKLERDRKRQKKRDRAKAKRDAELEARRKRREARKEKRRQRADERAKKREELRTKRRERRERWKKTTSPKSPKAGTKKVRSASISKRQIPEIGDKSSNVGMEKSPSKGKSEQK